MAHCLERRFLIRTNLLALCAMTALTTLQVKYVVRGYHDYKRVWTPVLDEMLSTEIEKGNPHDKYAVVRILDGLLLVESRALLVIVLCGICGFSLGRFLGRPTGRFGVVVVRAATVRGTGGRSGQA